MLDRKYKTAIQNLAKAQKAAEVTGYWNAALTLGDIGGTYWALLTHPDIAHHLIDRVYGEVHILSHLSGASIRVDLQELNWPKRRCPELETQLAGVQTLMRRLAEQQDIIGALNQRLAQTLDTEGQLQAARARLAEQTPDPPCTPGMADLIAQLAAERDRAHRPETTVEVCQEEMARTVDHDQHLAEQLAESRQERDRNVLRPRLRKT